MKVYTYSQARQNLAEVLNKSKNGEEVLIRRRGGESFTIIPKSRHGFPFDVPGPQTRVMTSDIIVAVRESRSRA